MPGKSTRMQQWINHQVRVTIQDGRMMVGTFLAFDRHMNVVLGDCEEFRRVKLSKGSEEMKEIKRPLGLIMLRGENIISLTSEAPPTSDLRHRSDIPTPGPGRAQPAGRGLIVPPLPASQGLMGPVRGVGGPAQAQMMPQMPQFQGYRPPMMNVRSQQMRPPQFSGLPPQTG